MRHRYQIMLVIAVALGVYYPSIFSPLNSVDDPRMYLHLLNTEEFTLRSIFLPGGSGGYYRPLLQLTFIFDKFVWGLEESFMHLDNILLHMGSALLLFFITRRSLSLLGRPMSLLPLAAALVFAIHPLNTEAVNWISGRTDLLASFFLLFSLLLLIHGNCAPGFALFAAISAFLACLSKESAVFFLPMAVLLPFFIPENKERPDFKVAFHKALPVFCFFLAAGTVYFLLRMQGLARGDEIQSKLASHVVGNQGPDSIEAISIVLKTVGFYAKKLILPFPLNFGIIHVSDLYIVPGVLVCLCIFWLLVKRDLKAFFFLSSAAVASASFLLPILNVTWTPVAERYMYIPSAFFIVGSSLAVLDSRFVERYKRQMTSIAAGIAVVAAYGTISRNILWQDNLALFQDTLSKSPDFAPVRNEIAIALHQKGRSKEANDIFISFEVREEMKNYQKGLVNKATALADMENYAEARETLLEALSNPGKQEVYILETLLKVNKLEISKGKSTPSELYKDNEKWLLRLHDITGDPFYMYRLGIVHMGVRNYEKALAAFTKVCKIAPQNIYYRKPAETLRAKMAVKVAEGCSSEGDGGK